MGKAQEGGYKVLLHRRAARYYEMQEASTKRRLDEAFRRLRADPYRGPNIKRLVGDLEHLHRYRAGDLRIIYEVHEKVKIVRVKDIRSRGNIYK